ncbi:MAG TPA: DUF402 domain-containing protein [Pseudonocardiaceae bacterium]
MAHIHPPKHELFDVAAGTNTDPKGQVRVVDEYREEPYGLYMARPVVGHPRIAYLESWLLPELGIRANDFWHHEGDPREWDTYVDIVTVTRDGDRWHTVDHYLDLGLRTGEGVEVLDIDELTAAMLAGLIDGPTAEAALATTFTAVDGIAAHGHDLTAWLTSTGITPAWRRR